MSGSTGSEGEGEGSGESSGEGSGEAGGKLSNLKLLDVS